MFKLYHLTSSVTLVFFVLKSSFVIAENLANYNASFLRGDIKDLEQMIAPGYLKPGTYLFDVYINDIKKTREQLDIVSDGFDNGVCLTESFLARLDILADSSLSFNVENGCLVLGKQIRAEVDSLDLSVRLTIPQIYLSQHNTALTAQQELWDYGVDAAFVNYWLSGQKYRFDSQSDYSLYGRFESGINYSGWRFRNESIYTSSNDYQDVKSERLYAEHDLDLLRGQFAFGQLFNRSNYFTSSKYIGLQLYKDNEMFPQPNNVGSPVISGVVATSAVIEVKQSGKTIYVENVPAGAYSIKNIPVIGSYGELEVSVKEADGHIKTQIVGFGSSPNLVERGDMDYRVNFGQIIQPSIDASDKLFISGDLEYGLFDNITYSGGIQGMKDYISLSSGVIMGTRIGSYSFDFMHTDSRTDIDRPQGDSVRGQQLRGRYFYHSSQTDTSVELTSIAYKSSGFRDLEDHIFSKSKQRLNEDYENEKFSTSINIVQQLSKIPSNLSARYHRQGYWDGTERSSIGVGYNFFFKNISFSLFADKSFSSMGRDNAQISLSASVPFDLFNGKASLSASHYNYNGDKSTGVNISGTNEDYNYSYSVRNSDNSGVDLSTNHLVKTAIGDGSIGYSRGDNYESYFSSWNGSSVIHDGNIFFSPLLGDSFTIIEAPNAEKIKINGAIAKTNKDGYAAIPNNNFYNRNWIDFNLSDIEEDLEIYNPNDDVIPRRGSITKTSLDVKKITRVHIHLVDKNAKPLPFGTSLLSEDSRLLGLADPYGRVFLSMESLKGKFIIKHNEKECQASYDFSHLTTHAKTNISSEVMCD